MRRTRGRHGRAPRPSGSVPDSLKEFRREPSAILRNWVLDMSSPCTLTPFAVPAPNGSRETKHGMGHRELQYAAAGHYVQ